MKGKAKGKFRREKMPEISGLGGKDDFRVRYPRGASILWREGVLGGYIAVTSHYTSSDKNF